MGWGWDWYPRPKPRRAANGIKAQSKQFGKTWWASKWLAALDKLVDPARLQRGRSYARSGQVLNIDIQSGRVEARVQGSRPQPYKVWIKVKALSEKEWDKVADAMAAQAIFAAKLLAGQMPQNIEEAFTAARVSLFPTSEADLETDCSCPDWANPCKHIAAVYYLLGEQFDADPFLIFRLRGMNKAEITSLLRLRRATSETEPGAPSAPKTRGKTKTRRQAPAKEPLEKSMDQFWDGAESLDDFRVTIQAAEVNAAPVKRLGAPGFWHGKDDFTTLLSRAYEAVTEASVVIALGVQDNRH
jgi:uncharacterized Zn finger protein